MQSGIYEDSGGLAIFGGASVYFFAVNCSERSFYNQDPLCVRASPSKYFIVIEATVIFLLPEVSGVQFMQLHTEKRNDMKH